MGEGPNDSRLSGVDRRGILGLALAAAALPGVALAAGSGAGAPVFPPATPAAGDPHAPTWPVPGARRLWPDLPPGAPKVAPVPNLTMNGAADARQLWVRGVAMPELVVRRPARPNGIGLLSLPGGGYEFLSVQNEGLDVADGFTQRGYTVFILSYRLPGEGWAARADVPLQDAQRALRLIRADAAGYGVDPNRVGVIGFSAGGHLAASLATAYDEAVYAPVDAADTQSARPSFAGLLYPVISLRAPLVHPGSRDHLLGPDAASDQALDRRSPALHVTPATPPTFLAHALDDGLVPADNTLTMLASLRAAGVNTQAHLFTEGGHGFGLHAAPATGASTWPDLFDRWIRRQVG